MERKSRIDSVTINIAEKKNEAGVDDAVLTPRASGGFHLR
jgi:hypothetical protein